MASIRTLQVLFTSALVTLLTLPIARAVELPPGVKALPVNDYDMAYMEHGNGRPLIMVHGALTDYRSWSAQMEPLGQSNRRAVISRGNSTSRTR
jgi:hypothetical protein